jgi:hypothetical protein
VSQISLRQYLYALTQKRLPVFSNRIDVLSAKGLREVSATLRARGAFIADADEALIPLSRASAEADLNGIADGALRNIEQFGGVGLRDGRRRLIVQERQICRS